MNLLYIQISETLGSWCLSVATDFLVAHGIPDMETGDNSSNNDLVHRLRDAEQVLSSWYYTIYRP